MIWKDWLQGPRQFKETNLFTLPETNIVPENGPSQKETHLPTIHFQVRTVSFRDKNSFKSYLMVQAMSDTSFEFFDVGIFTVAAHVFFWKSICFVLNEQLISLWRIWIHNESRTWWSSNGNDPHCGKLISTLIFSHGCFFSGKERSAPKGISVFYNTSGSLNLHL